MAFPDKTIATDRPLLHAAIAAVEQGDLRRADALFLQHLAQARSDAVGIADYGNFTLQTGRPESACYLLYKASQLIPGDPDVLSQLGYARLETKDFEGAQRSFDAALAIDPKHAHANYGIALCHQQAGAWPDAAKAFEHALAAQPDSLPFLLNLAGAYQRIGDARHASAHFEKAERLAPGDLAMLMEYAKFLRDTRSYAQALQTFDRLAKQHPNEPTVVLETARCLHAMGDNQRAMQLLETLNKLSPGMAEYHEELGNCMQSVADDAKRDLHWGLAADQWIRASEFSLAEPLLEKMLAANPNYVVTWILKGIFHQTQRQYDQAEAADIKAIETDPNWLDGYANLATVYEQSNRIEQAKPVADAGLGVAATCNYQPLNSYVTLLIVSCKIARRQKDYTRSMQFLDQIDALEISDLDRLQAAVQRGKVLDLLGDADGAIAAFGAAKSLARIPWQKANPGRNTYLRGVEYMLDLAAKGWLQRWRTIDAYPPGTDPVFLVGFPRSGTSLLNQILYCHSTIQTIEEKPMVQRMRDAVRSMPLGYPLAIPDFDSIDVAYLRDVYFKVAAENSATDPSKLLVDKFPLHVTMAGLIHRVFPAARFIFALRHPCDVILSCFMQGFRTNEAMANFFTLADAVKLYTRTMDLWQAYRDQLGLRVHTIRYEDVVDDFDGKVHALCDFLQVPWEDGLTQFATRALDRVMIATPSYEQVSKPIYRDARYRWERYRKHLEPFLPALQPYIERFGYADSLRSN